MKIHIIGIGGIGTSALARYFLKHQHQVSGSDITESEILTNLRKLGIKIFISHRSKNISSTINQVIYSAAIRPNNPELRKAGAIELPVKSYAQALGDLTRQYFTIAVCGSHGKSTTTALLGLILIKAELDPTVIIGTKLKEFNNTNFRHGKSKYLVIEADEYDRSFHNYFPQIIVATNIDAEHLDTYENLAGVRLGFKKFFSNLPTNGCLVANFKDKNVRLATRKLKRKIIWFNQNQFKSHSLKILGLHNQLNAEATWQTAQYLGVNYRSAQGIFKSYQGAWRRMEIVKPTKKIWRELDIFSDYAHHPTEIKATLTSFKKASPDEKVVCIFQPHQQDRLTRLFADYIPALSEANELYLLPTYIVKGRDNYLKNRKTSFQLYLAIKHAILKGEKLQKVFYKNNFNAVINALRKRRYPPKTKIIFMGAGTLDKWVKSKL